MQTAVRSNNLALWQYLSAYHTYCSTRTIRTKNLTTAGQGFLTIIGEIFFLTVRQPPNPVQNGEVVY